MEEPDNIRVNGGGGFEEGFDPLTGGWVGESKGYEADGLVGVKLSLNVAESELSGAGAYEDVEEAKDDGKI